MEYVSLLPPEIKKKRVTERKQGRVVKVLLIVIAVLIAVYAFVLVTSIITSRNLQSLRDEREETEFQAAGLREYEDLYNEMNEAEDQLNDAMGRAPEWSDFLYDLGLALNPNVSLVGMNVTSGEESGRFSMEGWTHTHGHVAEMLEKIQELEQLAEVRCRVLSEEIIDGRNTVRFSVDGVLTPGPLFFDTDGGGD